MKKNLVLLGTFLCILSFFVGCSDDKKDPEPPTVEQVVGEYAADKLHLKVDGQDASANAKISIVKSEDNTVAFKLLNIIPGIQEFTIPNIQFDAVSRSAYISMLRGAIVDNVTGYDVTVEGSVENNILNASVTIKEIEGEPVDVVSFYNMVFKGEMAISLEGEPLKMVQQVYIESPVAKSDTSMMSLKIENFSFGDIVLGNITIDTIQVVKRENVYGFVSKNVELELPVVGKVTLDARGGIVNGNMLSLHLVINASPLTVYVTFEGDEHMVFTMDRWITPKGAKYQEPKGMATSNEAAKYFTSAGVTVEPYPVTEDKDEGAAKIITRDTKGKSILGIVVPKVTAGTLFNGSFNLNPTAALKSTHFGTPYRMKPTVLKVSYKYIPGLVFYETKITGSGIFTKVEGVEVPGKVDECSVAAYLYEVDSYDEYLDGTNINAPESRVILKATLDNGGEQKNFVEKELKFVETGKGSYDPTKKYKLAIVCTPSKEGDAYKGAPESTLWVKYLEVVSE